MDRASPVRYRLPCRQGRDPGVDGRNIRRKQDTKKNKHMNAKNEIAAWSKLNKAEQAIAPPNRTSSKWATGVCLLLLIGSLGRAWADTYVCGTIAGQHWTTNGSPYRVTCDVSVGLLTIDPGVMVLFEGNYVFEVAGFLIANGTEAGRITFTRTNGVGWQGIFFNYSYDGSEMDYCNISGAQNSGIRCISANPVLRSCVLSGNSAPVEGGGLQVNNVAYPGGDMLVEDCSFTNNTATYYGGGVAARTGTNWIRFVSCTNISNAVNPAHVNGNGAGGGVYLVGIGSFDACLLQRNTVWVNGYTSYGGGIYWNGQGSMRNTFIRDNACLNGNNHGGGASLDGSFLLQNCVVAFNTASYGGIYKEGSGAVSLVNCILAYNNVQGFYLANGSAAMLNSILYFNNGNGAQIAGSPTVTYSCIQNGYPGTGNIASAPVFTDTNSLMLSIGSRCIDAGNPATQYNDSCDPPSFGPPRGYNYTWRNDMGAYGGPGACCWDGSCTVVDIRSQPQPQTACVGNSATFGVGATGSQPITYQWRFHGTNCAGTAVDIPGATNATYTIINVQSNLAGCYSVRVSNPLGSVNSDGAKLTVTPVCVGIDLYAGLTVTGGTVGQKYRILSTFDLTEPVTWTSNASITMAPSGILWIDTNSPANKPKKFYLVTP